MKQSILFALWVSFAGGANLLLSGCESTGGQKMSMAAPAGDHRIACQACYDEVKAVPVDSGKGTRYHIVRRHKCSGCKTETTLYTQDGVAMFKCSKCAPDGVPCDKCRPPKTKP